MRHPEKMDCLEWYTVKACLEKYPALAAQASISTWGGNTALRVLRIPQPLIPYVGKVRHRHYDILFFMKSADGRLLADIVLRFATVDPKTKLVVPGAFVHWEGLTVNIHFVPQSSTTSASRLAEVSALRRLGIHTDRLGQVLIKAFDPLLCPLEVRLLAV